MSDCAASLSSSWYLRACRMRSNAKRPRAFQEVMRNNPWYGICAAFAVQPVGCHGGGGGGLEWVSGTLCGGVVGGVSCLLPWLLWVSLGYVKLREL